MIAKMDKYVLIIIKYCVSNHAMEILHVIIYRISSLTAGTTSRLSLSEC